MGKLRVEICGGGGACAGGGYPIPHVHAWSVCGAYVQQVVLHIGPEEVHHAHLLREHQWW